MWSLTVGQPWPAEEAGLTIPDDISTFGWHFSGADPFLVLGDPEGLITGGLISAAELRFGFVEYGPLTIMLMTSPDWPFATVDAPRPYLIGDDLPEVTWQEGDRMLWSLITVSRNTVVNIRAFTTSPQVTVFLRRRFAEQRAHGPIPIAESNVWIERWQDATPTEEALWSHAEVRCRAGD